MVAILQTIILKCTFLNENVCTVIQISVKFVLRVSIDCLASQRLQAIASTNHDLVYWGIYTSPAPNGLNVISSSD